MSLHWLNLGNQPVEVLIEDVYLLVIPSAQAKYDAAEEADRMHTLKMARVNSLDVKPDAKTAKIQGEHPFPGTMLLSLHVVATRQ